VLDANPVRDVEAVERTAKPKGAVALSGDELRTLLGKLRASDNCKEFDLVDPVTVLIATGLRRSELLALRWSDFDEQTGRLTVAGKVVRAAGTGLVRLDDTKSDAGHRTVAREMLSVYGCATTASAPG
jgi:integrase